MTLPRSFDDNDDHVERSGSTLVPIPRRRQVAVTRCVQIEELSSPETWATVAALDEPENIVDEEAMDEAADRAEAAEERGTALDDELQASMNELLKSLPPAALPPTVVPKLTEEPTPVAATDSGYGVWLMLELVLVVMAGFATTTMCSAWVLSRIL